MKRCRSSSKLQFLTPICIRLVLFYLNVGRSSGVNYGLLVKNLNVILQHVELRWRLRIRLKKGDNS